jgi:hypothetical protein
MDEKINELTVGVWRIETAVERRGPIRYRSQIALCIVSLYRKRELLMLVV